MILRRLSPNALKLAAANADDWHPNFIVKLRMTAVSPAAEKGWKLMHRLVCWRLDRGDAVLDRLLHLLEGARLDLAHALA